jgi:hypothetical protein
MPLGNRTNPMHDYVYDDDEMMELYEALTGAMDTNIKQDSKDPKALYKLTVDSIIGPNKTDKTYTEADDKKLQLHMDSLAADLFRFSQNPAFVIEASGDENFTSAPFKPDKSAKWYAAQEAKKAKRKEANQ